MRNDKMIDVFAMLVCTLTSLCMVGCTTISKQLYSGPTLPADQVAHIKSEPMGLFNVNCGRLLSVDDKFGPNGKYFGYSSTWDGSYDVDILPGEHTLFVGAQGSCDIDGSSGTRFRIKALASHTYIISTFDNISLGFGWRTIYDKTDGGLMQSSRYLHNTVMQRTSLKEIFYLPRKWMRIDCTKIRAEKEMLTSEQAVKRVRESLELMGRWFVEGGDVTGVTFDLGKVDRSGFAFKLVVPQHRDGIMATNVIQETVNFADVTNLYLTTSLLAGTFDEVSLEAGSTSLCELPFFNDEPGSWFRFIPDEKRKNTLVSALVVLCEKAH